MSPRRVQTGTRGQGRTCRCKKPCTGWARHVASEPGPEAGVRWKERRENKNAMQKVPSNVYRQRLWHAAQRPARSQTTDFPPTFLACFRLFLATSLGAASDATLLATAVTRSHWSTRLMYAALMGASPLSTTVPDSAGAMRTTRALCRRQGAVLAASQRVNSASASCRIAYNLRYCRFLDAVWHTNWVVCCCAECLHLHAGKCLVSLR